MPTSCPRQYLWGHNISYICHAIMLIARYLVLTCPCTCSAAHTMLLLHLTSYSRVRLFCLVYKWCDVHPNAIVVLCPHSCVPACLQNVLFSFAFEPLLLSGHATFPRHSPHHSCSRLLHFHSFFQLADEVCLRHTSVESGCNTVFSESVATRSDLCFLMKINKRIPKIRKKTL